MREQRKSTRVQATALPRPRPDYTAAVRYLDGRRDLFRVVNAEDMADARDLVLRELGEVRSLVIALRH